MISVWENHRACSASGCFGELCRTDITMTDTEWSSCVSLEFFPNSPWRKARPLSLKGEPIYGFSFVQESRVRAAQLLTTQVASLNILFKMLVRPNQKCRGRTFGLEECDAYPEGFIRKYE